VPRREPAWALWLASWLGTQSLCGPACQPRRLTFPFFLFETQAHSRVAEPCQEKWASQARGGGGAGAEQPWQE
jgi:hypothetical protein